MTDPAARDPLLRALAWAHPAWMLLSLGIVVVAARLGLRLRRARLAGRPPAPGARASHLRLAKLGVICLVPGLVAGPVSAVWLRGWEPLATFHGVVGLLTGGLFLATAWLGRRVERGRRGARDAHAAFAALALLAAGLAAVAGFVLLP